MSNKTKRVRPRLKRLELDQAQIVTLASRADRESTSAADYAPDRRNS